jgi:hypothetical protein
MQRAVAFFLMLVVSFSFADDRSFEAVADENFTLLLFPNQEPICLVNF